MHLYQILAWNCFGLTKYKTFPENWVTKQRFYCFDIDNSLKFFFFRNKTFLFFKLESRNFQKQFAIEFRETSQNFYLIRQIDRKKMKITIVWISGISWNLVRFHDILFQTVSKSFSFLSWKKKVLFLKKYFLSRSAKIDPKDGVRRPNFQWRFWLNREITVCAKASRIYC